MRDRIQLPLTFDPRRLQADLARLRGDDWIRHFVQQNYEGTWDVLPLRASANARHPVAMIAASPACTEFLDTPLLGQCPYFREVLAELHCPLRTVRLMKLAAGSMIKEHTDVALSHEEGAVRLHIPVQTNADVDFRLNGERVILREGDCWYLRLSDPHSVVNRGSTDRIHLVIDADVNPWLTEMLRRSDVTSE